MNKTLFRTLKAAGTVLASFFVASLSAQTDPGPVNFTKDGFTNICADGITFYDDLGPTTAYTPLDTSVAANQPIHTHTFSIIDANNYGSEIVVTDVAIDIDASGGEEDTLAVYSTSSGIATVFDDIEGSPNLVGYCTNAGMFNAAGATVGFLTLPVDANVVFAFKQTGGSSTSKPGWELEVAAQVQNFQEFDSEVRFTNGGNQPNKISNNNAFVLCPNVDYNFVFNVSNFNKNGFYDRGIDIDSIVVNFRDGETAVINNSNITHTGDATPGNDYTANTSYLKKYTAAGAYEIVYDVYDKNCGEKQFIQRLIVLDDPNYSYSSGFGTPPYTICQGDVISVRVAANGKTLTAPDFTENATTKSVEWMATNPGLPADYTLSADSRTLNFTAANTSGTYQLVVEYFYNQNDLCAFYDTIEITVIQPVYAGTESVLAPGFDKDIPFVCESETSFDLFDLLVDTSSTLVQPFDGTWTDDVGNVITNTINPSSFPAGGYQFTYTVSGNGVCPDDSEIVRLDVEAEPNAGYSMTIAERKDECSSINNLDLFGADYIGRNGNPDLGGSWTCTNVPGAESAITLDRFLDLTVLDLAGASSRDFNFQYSVTGRSTTNPTDVPCGDATGIARIRVVLSPNAGNDSILFICNTEASINLNSLLTNENYQGTGQWSGDAAVNGQTNVFQPSNTFDPRNITVAGKYIMSYKLDQPNTGVGPCADDQINITFNAILEPDAGDDGTAEACDTDVSFDLFTALTRIGNSANGLWYNASDNLVGGTGTNLVDLSAEGGNVVSYEYRVEGNKDMTSGRGCEESIATATVTVQEALLVGTSRENMRVCITDAPFAPYDTLGAPKDANGNWSPAIQGDSEFNAIFDPSASALNTPIIYKYSHPDNTPGCALLESIVSLTVYDLPVAGPDAEQLVDICNIDNTFDLTTLIGGDNGVNGALTYAFESTDGFTTVNPATGLVNITNLGDNDGIDYEFNYIVQSQGCSNDTAVLKIKVFKRGNAGNDNSFTTCTSDMSEFLLFDLINSAGGTDDNGTWSDVTGTGGLNGTDNLATFIPNNVNAVTDFPATGADTLYYIVAVDNCPDDSAAIFTYNSKAPLAGISNTPNGVDGPLPACETEEELDLFNGITDTYDEGGRWILEIWPPNRNTDQAFKNLRDNVNNNLAAASGLDNDLYFKGDGKNIFNLARFDSNYVKTHNGDSKELFVSPIFRFKYLVKDTTNFPASAGNYGYRCSADSAAVYVRVEADFTNTDNFNFELETDATIAGSKNPPLDITEVVVCETETDFLLNDYFPGLTDIAACVNAPQDDFVINTLPVGGVYNASGSTDYFVNAEVLDSSNTVTDFEIITLSVTNECGTAITDAPLELRIEPEAKFRSIDPITLCGNGSPIDLKLSTYIGEDYASEYEDFQIRFNPIRSASEILDVVSFVYPERADFALGSPKIYTINLEIDRMHCPDVIVPIEITVNRQPYAGEDQVGVKVCADGVVSMSTFIDPAATNPSTGQTVDQTGVFTCSQCSPAFTPRDYSSATVDKALYAGTIQEFTYTVTVPGCDPVESRLQLVFEKKPFAGISQTATICNNSSNVFLPALLKVANGDSPDGGGQFTPDPFKGKNGNFFDATQYGNKTIEFTYTVGGQSGDVCSASSAVLTLVIEDAPTAGTDGSVDVCFGDSPVNLFDGINGQADNIGAFEPINPSVDPSFLSGVNNKFFDFTAYVNAAAAANPTEALFYYVVETAACPADTSVITVNIAPAPKAGLADTIPLILCQDLVSFDLFTVLGNVETGNGDGDYSTGGVWSVLTIENGNITGSVIDPSSLSTSRVHKFKYTVSSDCGDAFSVVAIDIDFVPVVGLDVNDSLCSDGAVIDLSIFYPQFTGGVWQNIGDDAAALNGNLLATSKIEGATVDLLYVVQSELGECSSGSASVSLRVFELSDAGDEEEIGLVICKEGDDVDLFAVLKGESTGGTFKASAGIESTNGLVGSVLIVGEIPVGFHTVRYIVKSGPCDADTVLFNIQVADLSSESPYCGDFDGDGVANILDLDIDNDGVSNLDESAELDLMGDHDKDLLANFLDRDYAVLIGSDFKQGVVSAFDMDGDGLVNMFDLDSDGDGIFDIVEAFPDSYTIYDAPTSRDGKTDSQNSDGINAVSKNDKVVNTDEDDLEDYLDLDSDNDGILDNTENDGQAYDVVNTDGSGDDLADYRDTDSDNDGILDEYENTTGTATNPTNTDDDPIPDYRDLDSDNDGISDADEAFLNTAGIPENFDFPSDNLPNFQDTDSDNDLIADEFELLTNSGPGNEDFRNLDSDDDGIPDSIEGLCAAVGDEPNNADGEGAYDFQVVDADGDLLLDALEAGPDPTLPINSDGGLTYDFQQIDADGDGLLDSYEAGALPNGKYITDPVDSDFDDILADGLFDFQDHDSDNDLIPDSIEGFDFVSGSFEGPGADWDSDGIPDYLDLDSDNDGISDEDEAGPDGTNPDDSDINGIPDFRQLDSDNDGVIDRIEGTEDCDNDGKPNYKDAGDNCKITTFIPEGFSPNGDNVNETFLVPDLNTFPGRDLKVYNRWGGLVYENEKYDNTWSGRDMNGNLLVDGTYFYSLDLGLGQEPQTGYVYIIGKD